MTQPAVSRQIRTLENFLGVQLFERDKHGVRLTPMGEQFHRQVAPAFQIISSAATSLTQTRKVEPLKIRTYTTFASKWLIHRLPSFYVAYPNIKLNISNVVAPVNFEKDRVDLAIQFGNGQWPGVGSELLFKDLIQPVCSPKLLSRFRLVELEKCRCFIRTIGEAIGTTGSPLSHRTDLLSDSEISFSTSILTYQAAMEGVGVAVGQIHLLRNELNDGTLVPLFNAPFERKTRSLCGLAEKSLAQQEGSQFSELAAGTGKGVLEILIFSCSFRRSRQDDLIDGISLSGLK